MRAIYSRLTLVALLTFFLLLPAWWPALLEAQTQRRDLVHKPVAQLPDKAKRYALVIGVDDYQDSQISTLKGAANDARLLREALITSAGFDTDNVLLLTTAEASPEHQPTRGNILASLSNIQGFMPKDGLLLVAFSGHGMQREGKSYLLPTDAQINGDLALVEDTSINVELLSERIRRGGIKQVMLILDACRNNPEGRGESNEAMTASYAKSFNFEERNQNIEAFVKLYAAGIGQVAYESKEKKQGFFTGALIEGLKGAAANDKGEVTLARLVNYLQEQVPKQVAMKVGQAKTQKPLVDMQGYKADELVISVTVRVTLPKPVAAPSVDPAAVEFSFWESIKNSTDAEDFKDYVSRYPKGTFTGWHNEKSGN